MNNIFPKQGEMVKILFTNGYIEEGTVQIWDKDNIVLKNKYKDDYSIIYNPQNILVVKIIAQEKTTNEVFVDTPKPTKHHRTHVDNAMELTELHKARIQMERDLVREKLTTFKPSGIQEVNYDNSGILKSFLLNTTEED